MVSLAPSCPCQKRLAHVPVQQASVEILPRGCVGERSVEHVQDDAVGVRGLVEVRWTPTLTRPASRASLVSCVWDQAGASRRDLVGID